MTIVTLPMRLLLPILLASNPTGVATSLQSVRPGYWSTTNLVFKPVHSSKTVNRCITAEAIVKFTGCYVSHYKCTCPEQSNADGRISFHGECRDAIGRRVQLKGEGSYTPTTLQMSSEGHYSWLKIKVPFATHTEAHWLSDTCPPGAPGSQDP
jgi:hypothetical protein